MGIKKYKPTSPGTRFKTGFTFEEVTTSEPYKPLVKGVTKGGGRNNNGRITVRHRGGGHSDGSGRSISRETSPTWLVRF